MGIFNKKEQTTVVKQTVTENSFQPIVSSHSHVIKSGESLTKNIEGKPNWKLCICTVRMYEYRTSVVLHRSDIGTNYRAELWGDGPGSTSNWKYQYLGKVSLIAPTDSERVTVRYQGAGYYTWSGGTTPASWSSANNASKYCVECFHII